MRLIARRALFVVTALALGVALVVLSSASSGAAAPARALSGARGAPGPIRFSHAVIVDEQKPGFEPDVKVAPDGTIYSSVPNGFSTTISYLWSSRDHGNSYLPIPGTIALNKPATCAGGGDTDLFVDPHNALYFSDLQGLTNISDSVSTNGGKTWSTNCAGAGPNTPDDRMWFGGTGSLAKHNLILYQDFDVTAGSAASQNNALVETVSKNGTVFLPVVNKSPGSDCLGLAIQDCITGNEGISGNQVVDPRTGNVFIAHTSVEGSSGTPGVRVAEGKVKVGTPTTATWSESPNLDGALCPGSTKASDGSRTCVDKSGKPEEVAGENFATIAEDSAGYLYVTFTAGPLAHTKSSDPNFGALDQPEQIYVVHSLEPASSKAVAKNPSKLTWSAPRRITGSGLSAGTNTFPWITAGSNGRVAVAWYHTSEKSEKGPCASGSGTCTNFGASSLTKAEWTVQLGQSLNAHSPRSTYRTAKVSEGPVKSGQICTNGIGCTTGGDRSLGDFLEVTTDRTGAAVVSYVFDTSRDSSDGEEVGPVAISRQLSGPSLLASVRRVTRGQGPGLAMGSIKDPIGDDFYSAGGKLTSGGKNLDLTGASLANGPNKTLVARIHVRSLHSLSASPTVGGPDASWMIRWTVVHPIAKGPGGYPSNGAVYYAGMDNNAGAGKPTFFAGTTSAIPPPGDPADHTKYMTFPQTHKLSSKQASYNAKTGVITLRIPLADVGKPAKGTRLYSVTAFSATSTSPQSANTLFNQIDATSPFELVIGLTRPSGPPSPGGKGGSGGKGGGGKGGGGHKRCPAGKHRVHGKCQAKGRAPSRNPRKPRKFRGFTG